MTSDARRAARPPPPRGDTMRRTRPRSRLTALLAAATSAVLGAGLLVGAATASAEPAPSPTTGAQAEAGAQAGSKVIGYFTEWGVYDRNYHVKNIETSGSADKLTHINYSFGNVQGGKCALGDGFAATEKAYTAEESVDGEADAWDQPLRGNFNQLLKLKERHPGLKVLWSFGGWTWSGGFTEAAKDPAAFAKSCHDLVEDPRWAEVFDGIDVDWEYPNACGLTCDESGPEAFGEVVSALRAEFGEDYLVTAAIPADASEGGKLDATDYAGAAQYVDWYNPMTYDYYGAWDAQGPTAPHSPLTAYDGIPDASFTTEATIDKLKEAGVPASKLLLGLGFYGRGWTGVTEEAPGSSASGPPPACTSRASRTTRCSRSAARRPARPRDGVRALRRGVVELRHPRDHRREDGLQGARGPG
ncbi:glycoside hydrolase family 18 protein [Actinomadura keratinilytica]